MAITKRERDVIVVLVDEVRTNRPVIPTEFVQSLDWTNVIFGLIVNMLLCVWRQRSVLFSCISLGSGNTN